MRITLSATVRHRADKLKVNTLRPMAQALVTALLVITPSAQQIAYAAETNASAQQQREYNIAAGPLAEVVNLFASASGIALTFDIAVVKNMPSLGLQGRYSVTQGFAKLLEGKALQAHLGADGSYALKQIPVISAPHLQKTETMPEVAVISATDKETATGHVQGYVAKRSATATKTDTPILETPRAISVVTREQMDAQGIQTVEQGLRYTSGVLTEFTGQDLRYQAIKIRGFNAQMFQDGLRMFTSGGYSDWLVDPQGIERIEVLKGPASILYGQGSPAGIINQISKLPSANQVNQVGVSYGNYNRKQASFDLGGKLNEDGSVLFRINGMVRDSDTQTNHVKDDRVYIAPALTWMISDKTTLTVKADMTRDRTTPKSWYPDFALITPNPNGHISTRRFLGEPGFDHYNRDSSSVGYLFEHAFDTGWIMRQNMRYSHYKLDYQHVYADSFASDQRTLIRGTLISRTTSDAVAVDTAAIKSFDTGPLLHKVILGWDYQRMRGRTYEGFGNAPDLDLYNPVYGLAFTPPDTPKYKEGVKQNGLYAQDQIRVDRMAFNLGLRQDWALTQYSDNISNEHPTDKKLTGSAGAVYLFDNGFAPYTSYSTSFSPVLGRYFDLTPFKPETGKQYEIGLKYQPLNSLSFVTLSWFDLRRQNVSTIDPDHINFSIQTGEIRSRGIELEGKSDLGNGLSILGSYTYLDTEVTKSNDADELGKQPRQTARNLANAWLDYRFTDEALLGWGLGAGIRYVDEVPANAINMQYNNAYTLVDAALYYKRGPVGFSLNAMNLFDKEYTANFGNFYGQARTVTANLNYQW